MRSHSISSQEAEGEHAGVPLPFSVPFVQDHSPCDLMPQGGAFPLLPTNALTVTHRGHLLGDF